LKIRRRHKPRNKRPALRESQLRTLLKRFGELFLPTLVEAYWERALIAFGANEQEATRLAKEMREEYLETLTDVPESSFGNIEVK